MTLPSQQFVVHGLGLREVPDGSRSDTSAVENLGGWLTTVVARVCLNMLQSRRSRREEPLGDHESDLIIDRAERVDPEREVVLADSVGLALLVVLETLTPAERLAFVLHDMFAVPFDEIAPIVDRTPEAARQLARRARRRVQGADPAREADPGRQREVVDAFLAASRNGDFDTLLALLDPDVVLRADVAAVRMGAIGQVRGAADVASTFSGRARAVQPALLGGSIGAVWIVNGRPRMAFAFTVAGGKVIAIDMVADPDRLGQLDPTVLD
jgi:DNA-directed RNA polymerase specialized sigma24 family protein